MFNAESNESPLRGKNTITRESNTRIHSKRIFPEKQYGNNKESPSYLQLPLVHENIFTRKNIYASKKETRDSSLSCLSSPVYIKELTKLTHMPAYQVTKNLSRVNNINNLIPFTSISPRISNDQSSYLKNVNEFNIRESNGVDPNRVLIFKRKSLKDYNCVNDRNIYFTPDEIKIEKWPVFYENYYSLADQKKAFHKKEGLFTKLVDHKLTGSSPQSKFLRKNYTSSKQENKGTTTPHRSSYKNYLNNKEPLILNTSESNLDKNINSFPFSADRNGVQSEENFEVSLTSSRRNISSNFNKKSFVEKKEKNKILMPEGLGKMNYFSKAQQIIEDHNLYRLKNYVMKNSPITSNIIIDVEKDNS